jgi:isopropylmalate/homocitrate/citramalate synthase
MFAGLTMVTNVPFYSFKDVNFRKSVPFIAVFLIALIFALISIDPPKVLFPPLFVLYGLSGYVVFLVAAGQGQAGQHRADQGRSRRLAKESCMSDRLIIFDTTLRDGEQSPGASMTKEEKVRIAKQLERLRVDVIEAGFAAASPGDFESIRAIATAIRESTVCSLSRANDRDIARAAEALQPAARKRIHTFLATSPLHMKMKLRMEPEQVLEQAKLAVRFARQHTDDIEFSPEDGSRSEEDFLCRVLEAVIAEGATTINFPDTVGYAVPELYGETIRRLRERIPNSDKAIWSVHCHNDLGLAVANSLAGVMIGGARQIECTINGLGERAGNTALEEVVMALRTRGGYYNLECGIDTTQIVAASKMVSQITGFAVQPNKAVVGANAFAHASGIHQDGILKARETYEIMRAEDVGWAANKIVLGKLSGPQRLQAALAGTRHRTRFGSGSECGVRALQGAGRPQGRDLRRRHHGAGERRGRAWQRALPLGVAGAALGNRRAAARENRVLDGWGRADLRR